jgi:hypothetical protein
MFKLDIYKAESIEVKIISVQGADLVELLAKLPLTILQFQQEVLQAELRKQIVDDDIPF